MAADNDKVIDAENAAYRMVFQAEEETALPAFKKYEKVLALRTELCRLVTGSAILAERKNLLIVPAQFELVKTVLDPYFASILSSDEDNDVSENGTEDEDVEALLFRGITPLVIACDRGNLACMLYICQLLENLATKAETRFKSGVFWEAVIGSPLKSKTVPDETTALHHCTTELAIQAEQREATDGTGNTYLELLERISIAQELLGGGIGSNKSNNTSNRIVLALGEVVNSHDDTPLMMAVANNVRIEETGCSSAKVILERWYTRVLQGCTSKELEAQKQNIQRVLSITNHDGNTVLSYAWQNGNVDLIKWLIHIDDDDDIDIITSEETLRAREYTDRLRKKLKKDSAKKWSNPYAKELAKSVISCEECIKLLELYAQKRAERVAEKLLEELEGDTGNSAKKTTKRKKKKKKKQKAVNREAKESHNESKEEQATSQSLVEEGNRTSVSSGNRNSESKSKDVLSLTKLANGRVAVKVPGHDLETQSQKNDIPPFSKETRSEPKEEQPMETKSQKKKNTPIVKETRNEPRERETMETKSQKKKKNTPIVEETRNESRERQTMETKSQKKNTQPMSKESYNESKEEQTTETKSQQNDTPAISKEAHNATKEEQTTETKSQKNKGPPIPKDTDNESKEEQTAETKSQPSNIPPISKETRSEPKEEQTTSQSLAEEGNHTPVSSENTNLESKTEDVLSSTKQASGTVAAKVPGHDLETKSQRNPPPGFESAWNRKRTFSHDESNQLLRDSYRHGSTKEDSQSFWGTTFEPSMPTTLSQSSDADSVLSALCLDTNCLLYSDTGMALNLSPAQLDAVEKILKEQLQSVSKARILQDRRFKNIASSSSLDTANEIFRPRNLLPQVTLDTTNEAFSPRNLIPQVALDTTNEPFLPQNIFDQVSLDTTNETFRPRNLLHQVIESQGKAPNLFSE